ncbi:MAG: response regulator [Acidobacteriia bacterium]|nr:response regulator [Terriglobia bacterium]
MEANGNLASNNSPRILIVDDEEAFLVTTAEHFVGLGYEVHSAREREEAVALINHFEYALVITDLALTHIGLAGFDVLKEIAEHHLRPKVVVLTGHYEPKVETEARRQGVDVFLRKPQRLTDLASVAASLLSCSGPGMA